jgi:hypothetical protein
VQRPAAHFVDHSGLFQDWNEPAERCQAGPWIIPPNQRLGAADFAVRKAHLGLVMEHEFPLLERLVQLIFEGELAGGHFGQLLRVKQVSIAARLGLLERGLGILEQEV